MLHGQVAADDGVAQPSDETSHDEQDDEAAGKVEQNAACARHLHRDVHLTVDVHLDGDEHDLTEHKGDDHQNERHVVAIEREATIRALLGDTWIRLLLLLLAQTCAAVVVAARVGRALVVILLAGTSFVDNCCCWIDVAF